MYNVLDVSRYIINYSYQKDHYMDNLKLQKVLYFVQVWFLKKTGYPCFYQSIEAWSFGPVIPVSYREFKRFGSCPLPKVKSYFVCDGNLWNVKKILFDDNIIAKEHKILINEIVDYLCDYSNIYLTKVTMKQKPWVDVYETNERNIITIQSLVEYFENNKTTK